MLGGWLQVWRQGGGLLRLMGRHRWARHASVLAARCSSKKSERSNGKTEMDRPTDRQTDRQKFIVLINIRHARRHMTARHQTRAPADSSVKSSMTALLMGHTDTGVCQPFTYRLLGHHESKRARESTCVRVCAVSTATPRRGMRSCVGSRTRTRSEQKQPERRRQEQSEHQPRWAVPWQRG